MSTGEWNVELSPGARRGLGRLPPKASAAVVEFIAGPLATNPHRVGRPLGQELAGRYAARRGAYRVVYSIDEHARSIWVTAISHRSDVYRTR